MSTIEESTQWLGERMRDQLEGLVISLEDERAAIAFCRDHLLDVLRRRHNDRCFFCGELLPATNVGVDVHHEPPLTVTFRNGFGRPTTIDGLRIAHRECHFRQPKGRA